MQNLKERRTKIVCTIGPASDSPEMLAKLIDAGMNVARINFSHDTLEKHAQKIDHIRAISAEKCVPVAILQDLTGPKIRIGKMMQDVQLEVGAEFILFKNQRPGDEIGVSTSFPGIVDVVNAGDTVLLADGAIHLEVKAKHRDRVVCNVIVGGLISSNKGINLPSRSLAIPSLTAKDKKDLEFGIKKGVDLVALSFVRSPNDVLEVKNILQERNADIPVISKIEKHEAIVAIDEIIDVSDGIMVARGDLAVETALEQVPIVQKQIIRKCNTKGKPVITATQMLKSMVDSPQPTRAEATDVANAVFDGTDAVMLSEETAMGKYPIVAVETMHRILVETEKAYKPHHQLETQKQDGQVSVQAAVSQSAVVMANQLDAAAIVTPTRSGSSARMVARFRPGRPVLALCTDNKVRNRLCVVWGVYPFLIDEVAQSDEILAICKQFAMANGFAKAGERIIITAGWPLAEIGSTKLITVEEIAVSRQPSAVSRQPSAVS
ncbi:MAG: pyruvate kinase, partial [bacterium]